MKKILTFVAGFALIYIALRIIGPIILLGVGTAITYFSVKTFIKSPSLLGKLWWGIVAIGGISVLLSSIPVLVGIATLALLFYGYKQWKRRKSYKASSSSSDYTTDFNDFESDWKSIMSKHN